MSSRKRFPVAAVLLAVALALLATTSVMAETSAASQRLAGPNTAIAALPVTPAPIQASHGVVRLYGEPDTSVAAFSVVMPSAPLWILGMSDDLAFYAVTTSAKSREVSGWVPVGDVSYKPVVERANRLAVVYRQRDTGSGVVNFLTPEQQVRLLGISPDGKWAAVANLRGPRSAGWMPAANLRRDYAAAQVTRSTSTHLRPDAGSQVYDALSLGELVVIAGRSADGTWIALMSEDGIRFRGWAQLGDVQHSMNMAALPVMTVS